jgi:hypothetical protein
MQWHRSRRSRSLLESQQGKIYISSIFQIKFGMNDDSIYLPTLTGYEDGEVATICQCMAE